MFTCMWCLEMQIDHFHKAKEVVWKLFLTIKSEKHIHVYLWVRLQFMNEMKDAVII